MKWERKIKPEPIEGQTRNKSTFLFFPKCINNEYRWLTWARWVEKYTKHKSGCSQSSSGSRTWYSWDAFTWL